MTAATIFEEVPVVLRMSSLAKAIVPDLTGQMDQENVFDRLDLTTHSFMEKNVQLLMRCLHSLNEYVSHVSVVALICPLASFSAPRETRLLLPPSRSTPPPPPLNPHHQRQHSLQRIPARNVPVSEQGAGRHQQADD